MVREAFFQASTLTKVRRHAGALLLALALQGTLGCADDASELDINLGDGGALDAANGEADGAPADASIALGRIAPVPVPLTLGEDVSAALAPRTPSWLFTFELTDAAKVELRTRPVPGGPDVDTVLTLSRINQNGLPRTLGTSDDFAKTPWSGLNRNLDEGMYRVVVRGATLRARGPFTLATVCSGAGCPAPASECLFGEVFSDLREHPTLSIVSEEWISSAGQLTSVVQEDQLVLAVRQSSFTEVSTPGEALQVVDQQQVRRLELREQGGARSFTVFEYGAGDNSYGAIFVSGSVELVASIHDGDLLHCTVRR